MRGSSAGAGGVAHRRVRGAAADARAPHKMGDSVIRMVAHSPRGFRLACVVEFPGAHDHTMPWTVGWPTVFGADGSGEGVHPHCPRSNEACCRGRSDGLGCPAAAGAAAWLDDDRLLFTTSFCASRDRPRACVFDARRETVTEIGSGGGYELQRLQAFYVAPDGRHVVLRFRAHAVVWSVRRPSQSDSDGALVGGAVSPFPNGLCQPLRHVETRSYGPYDLGGAVWAADSSRFWLWNCSSTEPAVATQWRVADGDVQDRSAATYSRNIAAFERVDVVGRGARVSCMRHSPDGARMFIGFEDGTFAVVPVRACDGAVDLAEDLVAAFLAGIWAAADPQTAAVDATAWRAETFFWLDTAVVMSAAWLSPTRVAYSSCFETRVFDVETARVVRGAGVAASNWPADSPDSFCARTGAALRVSARLGSLEFETVGVSDGERLAVLLAAANGPSRAPAARFARADGDESLVHRVAGFFG